MEDIYAYLKERLAGVQRLAVLGAGSVLKADDAAGVRVVEILQEVFAGQHCPALLLCVGETAPENFCGKINGFQPTHLLAIDAADMGEEPGVLREIDPEKVGGPTFCSHMLPLRVMLRYIVDHTGADVILLGIQHKSIAFDGDMTQEISASVEALSDAVARVVGEVLAPK